ncbi:hypothetical protein FA15DRAFT_741207 [Coprinopsis marcescibilis]|uniref:Uncharacterized protein n=1 Tax=Coprinopsis marcescibilis TaxID=230819 RepID=A0A5C3KVU7_COPMA|nr:hypothetical protein FA15DRAFT_741207 [Coprinopsis marcescibilis]
MAVGTKLEIYPGDPSYGANKFQHAPPLVPTNSHYPTREFEALASSLRDHATPRLPKPSGAPTTNVSNLKRRKPQLSTHSYPDRLPDFQLPALPTPRRVLFLLNFSSSLNSNQRSGLVYHVRFDRSDNHNRLVDLFMQQTPPATTTGADAAATPAPEPRPQFQQRDCLRVGGGYSGSYVEPWTRRSFHVQQSTA